MSVFGIITSKTDDFNKWYREILTRGKLIEYYDVSGCYVLLPDSYFVWEQIQGFLNDRFKQYHVQNTYFPLFITKSNLEKEASHIEGFAPEVAWISKLGFQKNDEEKDENEKKDITHIAIRPTSECAMYPIFSRLITTYIDLPLKYNQWCNVVRWEFKDPLPFIRSREFLWQEGHTCHRTLFDCVQEMCDILNVYADCYRDLLAVPVIKGYKTEKEKFGGAVATLTVEGYIPIIGKGVQCATSHCLGDNFSKIFNITYKDELQQTKPVYQNSWGFTTRSIGVMLMTHCDNLGIVWPPKVAPIQIVIIPIISKNNKDTINLYATKIASLLSKFRVKIDDRDFTTGWKHNEWTLKGTPLRIEVGPRDLQNNTIRCIYRDSQTKFDITVDYDLENHITDLLAQFHERLYSRALKQLLDAIVRTHNLEDFPKILANKKFCLSPFCGDQVCENTIKETTKAKSLCIPFENNEFPESKCVVCSQITDTGCLFGFSF